MIEDEEPSRDLAAVVVPVVGRLLVTGDRYEPYRLVGADGAGVDAVTVFFRDLLAADRSKATIRSYGMDLLRWFRFLAAVEVGELGTRDPDRGAGLLPVATGVRQTGSTALA